MISIDGSQGEGGGQVVRSALALSMVTGKEFEIVNVRGGRQKPGLARQHLTCVKAAAEVCAAEVKGAELKSGYLRFAPGEVRSGAYEFKIGTAGSTSLVAQTVLPALLCGEGVSKVAVSGGTHNMLAPPYDFLALAFLPVVNRMGASVEIQLERYGFYPAGGGRISMQVTPPEKWCGIQLHERGKVLPSVKAVVSELPLKIAEREVDTICRKANWSKKKQSETLSVADPCGPGNIVMICLESDTVTELFSRVGQIGIRAEEVARKVLKSARRYIESDVPVGPHLADQLMMPMALAARSGVQSSFDTVALTKHSLTHIEILKMFLSIDIETQDLGGDKVRVAIG